MMWLFFAYTTTGALAQFATMELSFSTDGSTQPSRALVTELRVGIPPKRYSVMLDFNASHIEFDQCVRTASSTFDTLDNVGDVVLFEDEQLISPEPREYFRLPIVDHCNATHQLSERYYGACVGAERCMGTIGLSSRAPVWQIWPAFTLSIDRLHLGFSNPHYRDVQSEMDTGNRNVLHCSGARTQTICEFEASLGGRRVTVDFHTDDSYTYVPEAIYVLYMAGVSLERVHGSAHIFVNNDTMRAKHERTRHTKRNAVFAGPPEQTWREFHAALRYAHERAEHRRGRASSTQHTAGNGNGGEWPPLVFEPWHTTSSAVIEIDHNLLVHSPAYTDSYGGVERGANNFLSALGGSDKITLLLKPHPTEPYGKRVSIGNGFLRRYTLHKNVMREQVLVEERVVIQHMSLFEIAAFTLLAFLFARFAISSNEKLERLTLCLPIEGRVPRITPQQRHVSHSFREAAIYTIIVAVSPITLARLDRFVEKQHYPWLYVWAWTVLGVNTLMLVICLLYSLVAYRGLRPPDGSLQWRSFRLLLWRTTSVEQLSLLGALLLTLVLRGETLGSPFSSAVAFVMIGNATIHCYQALRYATSLNAVKETECSAVRDGLQFASLQNYDRPGWWAQTLWSAYFLLVVFLLNWFATIAFLWTHILRPLTLTSSLSFALLSSVVGVYGGVYIVERYSRHAMNVEMTAATDNNNGDDDDDHID